MAAGNWAGIALAGGLAFTGCAAGPSLQVDPWEGRVAAPVRSVSLAGGERAIVMSEGYAEVPASAFSESVLGLLADRGFTRADQGTADLWLRAHLLLKRGGGRQEAGRPGGHGRRGGAPREERGDREDREAGAAPGSPGGHGASSDVELVLELVRRATGERVWTGTAVATLAHPFWSPEGRQELLDLAGRLLAPVHGAAG